MATWKVENLHVTQTGNNSDVVTHVDWVCDGNHLAKGRVELDAPGQPFVSYDELTEEQALSWAWDKINKAKIEEKVNAPILPPPVDILKPLSWQSVVKPLPWGN
jgi:hypothetical protein